MYMPLCRECHTRESKFHEADTFVGDPTIIYPDLENEVGVQKGLIKDSSSDDTSASKSFKEECDCADDLQLRQKQQSASTQEDSPRMVQ